jgi:hypothetical protein
MAERTLIRPPSSQLGPIDRPATRAALMGMSPLAGKYETAVDRESAFEVLRARAEEAAREAEEAERAEAEAEEKEREFKAARRYTGEGVSRSSSRTRSSRSDSVATTFAKSFARQLGTNRARRWCAACWAVSSAGGEARAALHLPANPGRKSRLFRSRPSPPVTR